MQSKLQARLRAAAQLVLPGKTAADIGTDHNYLPVFLVNSGICPFVIASDKAAQAYENARRSLEQQGLASRISLRQGDGLSVLAPGEAATLILAGMGGRLIMEILAGRPEVTARAERLVLQPQKNADSLRYWLADHGWRIVEEMIAWDSGFYYVLIAAEPGSMDLSADEAAFGPCLLKSGHPLFLRYLRWRLSGLESLTARLRETAGGAGQSRLADLEDQACRIQRILAALPACPDG